MSAVFWLIIFIIVFGILAFKRAAMSVYTISFFILLLLLTVLGQAHILALTILWIVFVVIALSLNVVSFRRQYFSRYILSVFRRLMPTLSDTEREALAAGNVGWTAELFSGNPNWQKLLSLPRGHLTAEEREFIEGPVEELCGMIDDWSFNHCQFEIPEQIWQHLKQNGYFGLIIPKKYGGKEFSALAHSQIITKISSMSTAVASVASVPNSLGPAELLMDYGTDEQKNYYLPRLARGEEVPCFALTSAIAGSDASSIEDNGIVCKREFEGKQQIGILLNWSKRYITLSPIATVLGLAFKLYDPDHLLGDQENIGITCALIPANTTGVETGRRHYPLCSVFPNGPTTGSDVFIPLDWIIGGPAMAGQGWRMLMESLAAGRGISLPSMVLGSAKRSIYATGAYARIRHQFGVSIGKFGGIAEVLAAMTAKAYMIEALRLFTVTTIDRGLKPVVASAISKFQTTTINRFIISGAMDIQGGKGIIMGPKNYLAQGYIEAPIAITVEGANILTRSMIIFGQGAIRCHPYLLAEITAAEHSDDEQALVEFDKAVFAHGGLVISNLFRSLVLALTSGYFARAPRTRMKRYYQRLSRYTAAFAFVADMTMTSMGGQLKRAEQLSARLADVLSDLYMASAVLKYYDLEQNEEAYPIVRYVCQDLFCHIEQQLHDFLNNMPHRFLRFMLRVVVFPVGRRAKKPRDYLHDKISRLVMMPSVTRERLTQHLYTANTEGNPIGLISDVLNQVIKIEPLEKKIRQAIQANKINGKCFNDYISAAIEADIISKDEAAQILSAHQARMEVINVDDFSQDEFITGRKSHLAT